MESKMKAMKFWKTIIALAVAYFAGGLWETTGQTGLEVRYNNSETRYLLVDAEVAWFYDLVNLILPECLTKLKRLTIGSTGGSLAGRLTSLKLPRYIGKEEASQFQLELDYPITL